jgi:hypothetical protein
MPKKAPTPLTTLHQKRAFLSALALCPEGPYEVATAAAAVGVHRSTPYRWRATDRAFAAQWDRLVEQQYADFRKRYEADLVERRRLRERRLAELRPIYAANAARARAAKRS